MNTKELIQSKRQEILQTAARYGAYNVRIFGSVLQGEETAHSDVDFLVELKPGYTLLDLGGLLMELQKLLDRRVDVVTENALHWYIRERVMREAEML
ncbi:MAG: nucleotidyltransferase family protein [Anaerolineales bacterium]|jgi:predicted nucleotidyltransferase|nr:nucleotidyltransferase family protein [Anaerolineales bacterium]